MILLLLIGYCREGVRGGLSTRTAVVDIKRNVHIVLKLRAMKPVLA